MVNDIDQLWDVSESEFFSHLTFINSSAIYVSLRDLQLQLVDQKTFGLVFDKHLKLFQAL